MTVYKLYIRLKCGALLIITGYDEATMYIEDFGDTIAYIIKEVVVEA